MPTQLEILLEGERRGMLNPQQAEMLAEARRRGMAGEGPVNTVITDQPVPAEPESGYMDIISQLPKAVGSALLQGAKDFAMSPTFPVARRALAGEPGNAEMVDTVTRALGGPGAPGQDEAVAFLKQAGLNDQQIQIALAKTQEELAKGPGAKEFNVATGAMEDVANITGLSSILSRLTKGVIPNIAEKIGGRLTGEPALSPKERLAATAAESKNLESKFADEIAGKSARAKLLSVVEEAKKTKPQLGEEKLPFEVSEAGKRELTYARQQLLNSPEFKQEHLRKEIDKLIQGVPPEGLATSDVRKISQDLSEAAISGSEGRLKSVIEKHTKNFFVDSLPPAQRVEEGVSAALNGKAVYNAPGSVTTGSLSPESEGIYKTIFKKSSTHTFSDIMLPESVLSQEPAGKAYFQTVREAERQWQITRSVMEKAAYKAAKDLPESSLEAVGRSLFGEAIDLNPAELKAKDAFRAIFDEIADMHGLKSKGKYLENYFTIVDNVSGKPKDVIKTYAGQLALDDAKAGKLGIDLAKLKADTTGRLADMVMDSISPDQQGAYLRKAAEAMKHQPDEVFYGPLSRHRSGKFSPTNFNALDVTLRYTRGATRKFYLDKIIKEGDQFLAGMSPDTRQYALHFFDSFRGVMGESEAALTAAIDNLVNRAETEGYAKLAEVLKFANPRRLSGSVKNWQSSSKIGGNLMSPLMNLSQTGNTIAEIGLKPVQRAITEYLSGSDRVRSLLNEAGVVFQEGIGEPDPGAFRKLSQVLGYPFRKAEEFNRGVAFLSGYNEALAAKKTHAEALKMGQLLVDRTQFIFSKSNLPLMAQRPLGSVVLQYKPYTINQMTYLSRMAAAAMKNPMGVNEWGVTNIGRLSRMILSTGAIGGAKSMVPASVGLWLAAQLKEEDIPDFVENLLLGGLPRVAGVDISENMGSGVFPSMPTTTSDMERAARDLLGPTFSNVVELGRAGVEMYNEDPAGVDRLKRTLVKNIPAGVQAARLLGPEEAVGSRERLIGEESDTDKVLRRLFGNRSTTLTDQIEKAMFMQHEQTKMANRQKAAEEAVLDRLDEIKKDPKIVMEIIKEYGAIPKNIDQKIIARNMPLFVRVYMSSSNEFKAYIMKEHPQLFKDVLNAIERRGEHIANQNR